jgi:uncharacterized membrane protein (UPF0127 family)
MKKAIAVISILALLVSAGTYVYLAKNQKLNLKLPKLPAATSISQPDLKTLKVANVALNIEIADTEEKRQKGLGGRKSLAEGSGMLFVFPQKQVFPSFWMKGMLIPLDMIWINKGFVVKIDKNVPAPAAETPDSKLPFYRPNSAVDYVLEVNAGFSDKNGIKIGDSVDLVATPGVD